MALLTFGINHKTAPVEVREKVVFPAESMTSALRELTSIDTVSEAAILSTCNRTELYCSTESYSGNASQAGELNVLHDNTSTDAIYKWFQEYHQLSTDDVSPYIYIHPDKLAVQHILRVASGLDSLVLGEPQILGQMKDAYTQAKEAGTLGQLLSRLFQYTFSVAKQIRTDTAIGASPVSVAFAAVTLARQIFGDLIDHTALLIGAGDTIELAARHLHEKGLGRMIIANRTLSKAQRLASQFKAYAIELADIPAHLSEADIVISSTASQTTIVDKANVEQALKVRKHRPVFMVDIAVPRDIDPQVETMEDVYLYTVDDLKDIIEENLHSRRQAALQAEEIIDDQVDHFMGWLKSLDAVETIRQYRDNADIIREAVLAKARQQLTTGTDPKQVIEELARNLTNKLIHTPSAQIKQAGYDERSDLLDAARELLGLDDGNSQNNG